MNVIQIRSILRPLTCNALAAGALWSSVAGAHHSFAQFDHAKLLAISGTVKEVAWANPHVWVYLTVHKADGSVEQWGIEGGSPNMLIRWGWNARDLAVGDKVTVDVHPARDGKHIGSLQTLFLPNGKALADPLGQRATPLSGGELAAGPGALPNKPKGEVYK